MSRTSELPAVEKWACDFIERIDGTRWGVVAIVLLLPVVLLAFTVVTVAAPFEGRGDEIAMAVLAVIQATAIALLFSFAAGGALF